MQTTKKLNSRDEVISQVLRTTDYEKFSFFYNNREINRAQVNKLKKLLSIGRLLQPIVTNEEFKIADGQHRFVALKELKLPIEYLVRPGITMEEVIEMNSNQKSWRVGAYVHKHVKQGKRAYILFKGLLEMYDLTPSGLSGVLDGNELSGSYAERLRDGNLELSPEFEARARKVLKLIAEILDVNDGEFRSTMKAGKWTAALTSMILSDDYDHKHFLKQLADTPKPGSPPKKTQVSKWLEHVYTKGAAEKHRKFKIDISLKLRNLDN